MNRLTITNDSDEAIVSLLIEDVEPAAATVAILNALVGLPKVRQPRADKGKPRTEARPAKIASEEKALAERMAAREARHVEAAEVE